MYLIETDTYSNKFLSESFSRTSSQFEFIYLIKHGKEKKNSLRIDIQRLKWQVILRLK